MEGWRDAYGSSSCGTCTPPSKLLAFHRRQCVSRQPAIADTASGDAQVQCVEMGHGASRTIKSLILAMRRVESLHRLVVLSHFSGVARIISALRGRSRSVEGRARGMGVHERGSGRAQEGGDLT
jgi:hypothetical protein